MHIYGFVYLGVTRQGKPLFCPFGLNPVIVKCPILFTSMDLQWCYRIAAASFIACMVGDGREPLDRTSSHSCEGHPLYGSGENEEEQLV